MLRFFIQHKKVRGAITIFLTIAYLSFYLMIGTLVDAGRVKMSHAAIEDMQQIATENIMSQYNRGLYEYYGLFGLSGYTPDDIAADVKIQIEESLGINLPEDVVKNFIEDVITGAKAAQDATSKLDSSNSTLDNVSQVANATIEEVVDSHNRFDPYGVTVDDVKASYIDLTNVDTMRAQMRDDMRYDALLFSSEAVLPAVEQLMKIAGGIKTMKTVLDIAESQNELKKFRKEYNDNLDKFSMNLKAVYKECYGTNWKAVDSLKFTTEKKTGIKIEETKHSIEDGLKAAREGAQKILNDVVEGVGNAIEGARRFFAGLFGGGANKPDEETSSDKSNDESNRYDHIQSSFKVEGSFDDDTDNIGLVKLINNESEKLNRYSKGFGEGDWPKPPPKKEKKNTENTSSESEFAQQSSDNSDGEDEEESDEARRAIYVSDLKGELLKRKEKYLHGDKESNDDNGIDGVNTLIHAARNNLDAAIESMRKYMGYVSDEAGEYAVKCEAEINNEDKLSVTLYASNIESNLKEWKDLKQEIAPLEDMLNSLDNLISAKHSLANAVDDVEKLVEEIKEEIGTKGLEWTPPGRDVLYDIRKSDIQSFHEEMVNIARNLNEFEKKAEGEKKKQGIFDIINASQGQSEESKKNNESLFDVMLNDKRFGTIERRKDSENEDLFDYSKYVEEKQNQEGEGSSTEFNNDDLKDFNSDNVKTKMKNVFDVAGTLVDNLIKTIVDNVYDISYITSHCRDFVHTYWYNEHIKKDYEEKQGKKQGIEDIKKEKEDLDDIFNKKFVEDRSVTEYLSDEDLMEYQVMPAEIEYIIFGGKDESVSARDALVKMYASIFALRIALNYLAVSTSTFSSMEIRALAASATLAAPIVLAAAPLIYAIPQTINETGKIFECRKVNLWNGGPNLHLFSGIAELGYDVVEGVVDKAKEEIEAMGDTMIEAANEVKIMGTKELLDEVQKLNHDPYYLGAGYGERTMRTAIEKELYEPLAPGEEAIKKTSDIIADKVKDKAGEMLANKNNGFQAGYTTYLLMFLFLNSFDKTGQIERLQSIIETNMRKAQPDDDFRLKDTYAQIAVETDTSVKFMFMTQSFMKKSFSKAAGFDRFHMKTKTAYAY